MSESCKNVRKNAKVKPAVRQIAVDLGAHCLYDRRPVKSAFDIK